MRRTATTVGNILNLKRAVRTAFRVQMAEMGFSMVEVISSCPTNWGMTPKESLRWIEDKLLPYYPLGDYKVLDAVKEL